MSQQWEYICGKHRFKTNDVYRYHVHIIDEHDTEHGFWQKAGTNDWTRDGKPYFGKFRFLPIYSPMNCNCRCSSGSGCWQNPNSCQEPERHQCKTPEEYKDWVDRKWKRK